MPRLKEPGIPPYMHIRVTNALQEFVHKLTKENADELIDSIQLDPQLPDATKKWENIACVKIGCKGWGRSCDDCAMYLDRENYVCGWVLLARAYCEDDLSTMHMLSMQLWTLIKARGK